MASKSVAKTTPAGLPSLPPTQSLDIDAGDVALPRIKVGQPQSPAIINDLAAKGCLFSTTGSDDEYPETLYTFGEDEGLLVHVLGMTKGKSITVDNELMTFSFDDPDAPSDARVTYNYVLYLPEVEDNEVPYKFLMTSTATSTAKQINTVLKRNEARGPSYITAFRLTTKKREAEKNGQKFHWYVPLVKTVDADNDHVVAAGKLAGMIQGSSIEQTAPAGESGPAI